MTNNGLELTLRQAHKLLTPAPSPRKYAALLHACRQTVRATGTVQNVDWQITVQSHLDPVSTTKVISRSSTIEGDFFGGQIISSGHARKNPYTDGGDQWSVDVIERWLGLGEEKQLEHVYKIGGF